MFFRKAKRIKELESQVEELNQLWLKQCDQSFKQAIQIDTLKDEAKALKRTIEILRKEMLRKQGGSSNAIH